jgi:hypothetical protein
LGGSNGPQSGLESRMSTLIVPLNGRGITGSFQFDSEEQAYAEQA